MAEFPFLSLREWLEFLDERGQLVHNRKEVDLKGEIAAIARKQTQSREGKTPAIINENVTGYPGFRIVSGTFITRERLTWALGVDEKTLIKEVASKLDSRVPPMEVSYGPCKEIKLLGHEVDLTKIPYPFTGEFEGTPNITSGISNKRDPDTGWQNIAVRRFGIKGKRTLSEFINPAQQDFAIWAKYRQRKEKMPVAITIGCDPTTYLASQTKQPPGVCEYDLWGAFTGRPLEVIKCETSDLLVPATAEIVIEGEIDPYERELDGPFPEHIGYYSSIAAVARVEVKAITMRKDPIYYYLYSGMPPTEGHIIGGLMGSISTFRELTKIFPGILDIHSHGWTFLIIKVDKEIAKNWAQFAVAVANVAKFQCVPDRKGIIVVDNDVEDISDYFQVFNAIQGKFQASKDWTMIPRTTATLLDPSEPWCGRWGWQDFFIMDCTEKPAPYDEAYKRGRAFPHRKGMEKVEKHWEEYGF